MNRIYGGTFLDEVDTSMIQHGMGHSQSLWFSIHVAYYRGALNMTMLERQNKLDNTKLEVYTKYHQINILKTAKIYEVII